MRSRLVKILHDGVVLFNERQFFEAHEVWEDGWRTAIGEDRLLLQGLIQVAAAFHKLQRGQPAGAVALFSRGSERLAAVGCDAARRVNLPALLASVETWTESARRMAESGATECGPSAFPVLPAPPVRLFSGAIHTQIEVAADARRVWEVLIDFGAYREWNPFLIGIRGEARAGTRLAVDTLFPGRRAMRFRPLVLRADPLRELRWRGRFRVPGLFEGEHIFGIARLRTGRVRFTQREMFRGLLVPIFRRTHLDATRRGFAEMNRALKERAEH